MVTLQSGRFNEAMKAALARIACLALIVMAVSAVAHAEAGNPLTDTLSLGFGTFILDTNTDIRVDGSGIAGTEFNVEHDLGIGDTTRFRIDGYWRFAKRHKIRVMYFDADRSVSHVLTTQITFRGTTYPINAEVDTSFKTTIAEVAYEYAFVRTERWELAASAGIHDLDFKLGLAGRFGALQTSTSQSASANGPLPVLGLEGTWRLTDSLYIDAQAQFFKISISPYDGRIEDYNASLVWQPLDHVAFGAGYDDFVTRVDVTGSSFEGSLRWRYSGARIFVTVSL